ncbi:MAG TPA: hypothetical protein VGX92_01895 [Pyrinomonadaceae bacterium]|jgi:hypothetical protein|nr:hypothetical protein [Pyrinomonadaceae bacterium]
MHEDDLKSRPLYEGLDTAYVNLAALLRHLRARSFNGRVHVRLDEYEADVFLGGEQSSSSSPRVRETNHAAGREAEGEAAMQRLLVRASEPGGQISVYESEGPESGVAAAPASDTPPPPRAPAAPRASAARSMQEEEEEEEDTSSEPEEEEEEPGWPDLLRLSGDMIAAVERATLSFGANFDSMFRAARLELADDFSFLDPSAQRFEYAHGVVYLRVQPERNAYLSSISECMRKVVDKLASAERGRSVRERVALELAVLARRRSTIVRQLKLMPYLDRIAGTRVL